MTAMVEAHGLRKRFGKTTALDGLEFEAAAGGVMAILGPNGAGKTTLVRAVATLVRPDEGTLRVLGFDAVRQPEQVRRLIGLAGQFAAVEPAMTGRENLRMVARLYGQSRRDANASAQDVLCRLDLVDAADRLVRTYSGGMRRRLDLGASLVGRPRLLLLDEPTTGLDPRSRIDLWDAIRGLVETGTEVLLTTQYLEEADQLADQILIVDHGKTIAAGSPSDLKRQVGGKVLEVRTRHRGHLDSIADGIGRVAQRPVEVDYVSGRLRVGVKDARTTMDAALRAAEQAGVELDDVALREPTLDEVFLALTGAPTQSTTTPAPAATAGA